MSLKLSDLDIKTKLPTVPPSLPVLGLAAPSLDDRRPAIARLGEQLKLGALRPIQFEHGIVMASPQGEITFFEASGAVFARDAMANQGATNEFRKWDGVVETGTDGYRTALGPDAAKRLIAQTRELLQPLRLIGAEVVSEAVQLDQVAQLDAQGKEVAHGAGQATVKFQYGVGGVPVRGAGAKTLAFAVPGTGQARFSGIFHAWRTLGKATDVKLGSLEEALGVGLLTDPELDQYHAAGHRIQITRLEFVSEGQLGISFHFGRFHHAAAPRAYAAADLFGPYLTGNPDGITATASKPVLV